MTRQQNQDLPVFIFLYTTVSRQACRIWMLASRNKGIYYIPFVNSTVVSLSLLVFAPYLFEIKAQISFFFFYIFIGV